MQFSGRCPAWSAKTVLKVYSFRFFFFPFATQFLPAIKQTVSKRLVHVQSAAFTASVTYFSISVAALRFVFFKFHTGPLLVVTSVC